MFCVNQTALFAEDEEYLDYAKIFGYVEQLALFNEDDEIVGILSGGDNFFSPIAHNMDFINEVIRIDPKVKIRGINQE